MACVGKMQTSALQAVEGRRNVLRDKEPKSQNTEIATTKLQDIVQHCLCSSCSSPPRREFSTNLRGVLLYRCGVGPAQAFDERKSSAEETRHVELSSQSGFFPGEPGTGEIPANPVPKTSTERREMLDPPEPAKSITLSKCRVFPTSVMSFNFLMWSR